MRELAGRTIGFLTANEGVEEVELTAPWSAVCDAGGHAVLIAPKAGPVQAMHHLDLASTFTATIATSTADSSEFDALVLPGGVVSADRLRMDPDAIRFVAEIAAAGKPIGVICHGPWTMIEANLLKRRTLTSWPSLQTDIRNAGGNWVNQEVVVCSAGPTVIVSSRRPQDLPAFNALMVEVFASARAAQPSR